MGQGEAEVIYPILAWILRQIPALIERAYLAKYLVKIEVPAEILQDTTVTEVHTAYQSAIQSFMEVHKAVRESKKSKQVTYMCTRLET